MNDVEPAIIEYNGKNIYITKNVPFPNLPRGIGAIIFPWAITLGILYFEFQQGYKTNPIVLFSIPFLYLLVFMPKDSWNSIKEALGLSAPTLFDKIVALGSIFVGIFVAFIFYNMATAKAGIIPLNTYDIHTLSISLTSVIILNLVVAFFEEGTTVLFAKISTNWLYSRGMRGIIVFICGVMLARMFWTSMHWFSYGGYMGPQTYPLFLVAFVLGMIFSVLAIAFGLTRRRKYFYLSIPAIVAHLTYNVLVDMHLLMII